MVGDNKRCVPSFVDVSPRFHREARAGGGRTGILQAGGNAFDAAVARQAVRAVTDFPNNAIGDGAVVLVYSAGEQKVYSVNAEPCAPRLATIEWYAKNNGARFLMNDGLLAGGIVCVVDAWYTLLARWATMSFAQVSYCNRPWN
jgi:gamma-glutamyltranspeptidase / glutathione hydrolase